MREILYLSRDREQLVITDVPSTVTDIEQYINSPDIDGLPLATSQSAYAVNARKSSDEHEALYIIAFGLQHAPSC
jgi:hypothetical protein